MEEDGRLRTMLRFEEILSNDDLLDAIYDMHFDICTPIQEQTIPLVLQGRDIMGIAQTGTGKTAAYLLPVIELLINNNYPQDRVNCVIMSPTRELAQQIDQQLQGFSYYLPISSMAIYGGPNGETYEKQRKGLKNGADIIIATPGRLLSHINMGYVDLSQVSFFILDEADRMLDMGFHDDILKIISRIPKERQTMLFSATMPLNIKKLADKILTNPSEIKIAVSKPAEKIRQEAYVCYEKQKSSLLRHLFKEHHPTKVIIFAGSKIKVKDLCNSLKHEDFTVAEMHSDLEQKQRDDVMLDFKSGKINVLIATDILSRGIDIDNIESIINYDVPSEAEEYVHRIGRTARADKEGRAITLVGEKEICKFKRIEQILDIDVKKMPLPEGYECGPEYKLISKSSKKGRRRFQNPRNRNKIKNKKQNNRENSIS